MKVNISYAVELEEVPAEVGKLIERCEQGLRSLHADFDMLNSSSTLETIKGISGIRESLASLDIRLSDCINILSGYLEVQAKLQNGSLSGEDSGDENVD